MTPVQIEKIQKILTEPQFQLFSRLNKMRDWMGELYLELILSQEDIEYIYRSETNICCNREKDQDKRSRYFIR